MEPSTTVRKMLAGNKVIVPNYQRAYSWDTPQAQRSIKTHTDVFLSDLNEYNKSSTKTPYYFGHFLFEEKSINEFRVIDGQQRLTTIIIFLCTLFKRLKSLRKWSENEEMMYEDIIKRKSNNVFSTVYYDNTLFKDYVIEQTKTDKNGLDTESAKRIVDAFDFFTNHLSDKDEEYLKKLLETISNATCTTHPVKDEAEAIQMFIFQNSRGKNPSNLELIKAQFMFHIHLYGKEERDSLIEEIKERFEKIYKSISSIEYGIDEDDVLSYTLQVYFNSLWETSAIDKINEELKKDTCIIFIKEFTQELGSSFQKLTVFFKEDEPKYIEIHSLLTLGSISISIPFIIKAYKFGLSKQDICRLATSLEFLVLRHRLIGTKALIKSRLNDIYQNFSNNNLSIQPIIDRISWMKTITEDWWAHWNNSQLERAIQGFINHSTARFLLWKYENYLEEQGKGGYTATRFDKIDNPELEHIAPQTENPQTGYCEYDEEFRQQYIDCLGNYLLISKPHNGSISNIPFAEKCETYKELVQQREVNQLFLENGIWTKELIKNRKEKIIKFILEV